MAATTGRQGSEKTTSPRPDFRSGGAIGGQGILGSPGCRPQPSHRPVDLMPSWRAVRTIIACAAGEAARSQALSGDPSGSPRAWPAIGGRLQGRSRSSSLIPVLDLSHIPGALSSRFADFRCGRRPFHSPDVEWSHGVLKRSQPLFLAASRRSGGAADELDKLRKRGFFDHPAPNPHPRIDPASSPDAAPPGCPRTTAPPCPDTTADRGTTPTDGRPGGTRPASGRTAPAPPAPSADRQRRPVRRVLQAHHLLGVEVHHLHTPARRVMRQDRPRVPVRPRAVEHLVGPAPRRCRGPGRSSAAGPCPPCSTAPGSS